MHKRMPKQVMNRRTNSSARWTLYSFMMWHSRQRQGEEEEEEAEIVVVWENGRTQEWWLSA
jgi:hypothetical protein